MHLRVQSPEVVAQFGPLAKFELMHASLYSIKVQPCLGTVATWKGSIFSNLGLPQTIQTGGTKPFFEVFQLGRA